MCRQLPHPLALFLALSAAACSSPTTAPSPFLSTPAVVPAPAPVAQVPVSVVVRSFVVIEVRYSDDQWYYAPQVRLVETSGRTGVTVTRMEFNIPGLGRGPAAICNKRVEAGSWRDLLGVDYVGNFETAYSSRGVRATGADATVTLSVVDDDGNKGTITASGWIVGEYPEFDGQDTIRNACTAGF